MGIKKIGNRIVLFICRNDTSCWNNLVYGLSRTLDIQEITTAT